MKVQRLSTVKDMLIDGPLLLTPEVYKDERGYFYELWNQRNFNHILDENIIFHQDNISLSKKGVIRGLHYQANPNLQSKLVTCRKGSIFDVAIDLRKDSNTFGKYVSAYLNEHNRYQLWIPSNFAHGFISLEDNTEVQYKVQGFLEISSERSIRWNDPDLKIDWPILKNKINDVILSNKDSNAPSFKDLIKSGDYFN